MITEQPKFSLANEQNRTYIYPSGAHLKVENPSLLRINNHPAGELHVINTATAGETIIVVPGWVAIKIQEILVPVPSKLQEEEPGVPPQVDPDPPVV